MSISMSIFATLEIELEFPSNGNSLSLRESGERTSITFYCDIHQWWALRNLFPKAKNYSYATINNDGGFTRFLKGEEAEAAAVAHYEAHKSEPHWRDRKLEASSPAR